MSVCMFQIQENCKTGQVIARVHASDDDRDSRLLYSIATFDAYDARGRPIATTGDGGSVYDEIKGWFVINATTGLIATFVPEVGLLS